MVLYGQGLNLLWVTNTCNMQSAMLMTGGWSTYGCQWSVRTAKQGSSAPEKVGCGIQYKPTRILEPLRFDTNLQPAGKRGVSGRILARVVDSQPPGHGFWSVTYLQPMRDGKRSCVPMVYLPRKPLERDGFQCLCYGRPIVSWCRLDIVSEGKPTTPRSSQGRLVWPTE